MVSLENTYLSSSSCNIDVLSNNCRIIPAPNSYLISFVKEKNRSQPYNSRVTLFNVLAALAITSLPVVVDPVKLILSGPGCDVSHGPRLSSPLRTCNTPGGKNLWPNSPSLRSQ